MFEVLVDTLRLTDGVLGTPRADGDPQTSLVQMLGGCTFERGLYRVHSASSAIAANGLVADAFPDFRGRFSCFGFDWLGRQFATDRARGESSDPEVLMFEPGTGEALEIPVPFSRFHDEELIEYAEAVLAASFFANWIATQTNALDFDECVGYRTPLFLGGEDALSNLEVSDIDVYWTIMGQLRVKAMNITPGTPITNVHGE